MSNDWSATPPEDEHTTYSRRFLAKAIPGQHPDECWRWAGTKDNDGYGHIWFRKSMIGAHRLSFILFREEPIADLWVCHSCDNPECTNPAHLFLGTHADNTADMVSKKRMPSQVGATNGAAKLSESGVAEMRARYAKGERQVDLARAFGVSQSQVSQVVRREKWTHVN